MVSHFLVTLTGSAQALGASIDAGVVKGLAIQADPGNSHVVYVGGANVAVSSTNYGILIPIPVTSIPAAPTLLQFDSGFFSLNQIYVIGTNTEKLRILVITP